MQNSKENILTVWWVPQQLLKKAVLVLNWAKLLVKKRFNIGLKVQIWALIKCEIGQ